MRAIRISAFGPTRNLVLQDVPDPRLRPGDVLVRVAASGVNPIEWKIRGGGMARALGREPPVTLGWECAGVVEAIGTDVDVDGFAIGDAVYAYPEFTRDGTHAERVAIDQTQLAPKPASLSFEQAAAVPMTAQAAWSALAAAGPLADRRVLIHGAAGSVGHWLTQLAVRQGAHVTASASGEGVGYARALGAEDAIDYREQRFEESGEFGVVFDLVGGETQTRSWSVLDRGGQLISTVAPPDPERAKRRGAEGKFVFTAPRGAALREIATLLDDGALRPLGVAAVRTLSDLPAIHADGEAGRLTGKVVLSIGEP